MRLKLLVSRCCAINGSSKPGDVIEIKSETEAERMIAAGHAVAVNAAEAKALDAAESARKRQEKAAAEAAAKLQAQADAASTAAREAEAKASKKAAAETATKN